MLLACTWLKQTAKIVVTIIIRVSALHSKLKDNDLFVIYLIKICSDEIPLRETMNLLGLKPLKVGCAGTHSTFFIFCLFSVYRLKGFSLKSISLVSI